MIRYTSGLESYVMGHKSEQQQTKKKKRMYNSSNHTFGKNLIKNKIKNKKQML